MAITQQLQSLRDKISSSEIPLLVVFYSQLCGPSHLMDTILREVDEQMQQRIQIIKVDAEEHSDLASEFAIHPLPTLLLFNNGKLLDRIEEERTEKIALADRLIERLEKALLADASAT